MNTDALLELLGIRPREAKSAEMQPIPVPANESLMDVVRRNQQGGAPAPVPNQYRAIDAQLSNLEREMMMLQNDERQSIARTERDRNQAAQDLTVAETQHAMHNRRAQGPGNPMIPFADPFVDTQLRGPGPSPQAPQYASLDRAGPPMAPPSAPSPTPVFTASSGSDIGAMVGGRGAGAGGPPPVVYGMDGTVGSPSGKYDMPPIDFSSAPQVRPPVDPTIARLAPFMNQQPPPDPFANPANPAQAPTGSPTTQPPAPTPNYTPPPVNPNQRPPFPFSTPSMATRLTQPAAEGGSMLDANLGAASTPPPGPFVPDGQLINWWNLGRGQAPTGQPTPARRPPPAPTPAPGPDQSTLLNQAELARFLAANPGGTPPPPAQPTPTPIVASNPPPAPVAPTPGATPMTPTPPPASGDMVPPHLRQQLLEEAARIVGQQRQMGVPAR